ncbi:triose-phosphate transporter family protein [Nitzschia inconspicua]|uniref:Triose-phosphate transporter family protein n=1 Tax=Nitzschia inconspicua TaxID=303405 RepID=A0A9K3LB94_9STRA|nr:triose-phosphate transporter family protein [Nitzschia inconspicua]
MKLRNSPRRWVMPLLAMASVLLFLVVPSTNANKPPNNFRVVLDSPRGNDRKTRLMLKNSLSAKSEDIQAMIEKAKKEFQHISHKTQDIARKVEGEARELVDKFKDNLQHYTKLELGLYAALTVALTVTLKTVVFSKAATKTLNLNRISYILASPAAMIEYEPVKELTLKRRRPVILAVTPSIISSDGKTYIRTLKQTMAPKPTISIRKMSPPLEPGRPAQVVVNTVSAALYEQQDEETAALAAASHNAVISTLSPSMRRSLKARRIRGGAGNTAILHRLEIAGYFVAWYALNVIYNIVNKKVLNVLPAPLIVGTIQFGIGGLYCLLIWLLRARPVPTLTKAGKEAVAKVGLYHALGQLASMISLGAGPVSFTHIVKAMEPFFSALVSGVYFQKWMPIQVYATLIPVVGGVGYACLKELNFSWLAFGAAMASNLFFALRAVMSKIALQSGAAAGTNLSPPNMFGLVTWAAFFISVPFALIGEGQGFIGLWNAALEQVESTSHFLRAIIVSGLFHYLNNEVMYLALGSVHPVTLAVGNTMKRVFILVASVMVFRNPITVQAGIGSAVGISGVLLYSLTKQYYENIENSTAKNLPSKSKISVKKITRKNKAKVAH